jgi:hypothetical protein
MFGLFFHGEDINMVKRHNVGFVIVTPEFEDKLKCINYICTRIKLHIHNDSMNTKYSAKA